MRTALALCLLSVGPCTLLAVDKVPEYSITDRYVTSPTMLVRVADDGRIREVWSGMDPARRLHVPLFLEMEITASFEVDGKWTDVSALRFNRDGTRPGLVRMRSTDGQLAIEVDGRRGTAAAPVYAHYVFSRPVELRLSVRFKYPEFTQGFRDNPASGCTTFDTLWRNVNARVETTRGPRLALATFPAGAASDLTSSGFNKVIKDAQDVLLCIDATEPSFSPEEGKNYAASWASRTGGSSDNTGDLTGERVSIVSEDRKLDRLFEASLDAIQTHQFASGDVMADVFFYRDSWLRDGTYTMMGLALAGDFADVDRYFDFWNSQRDFSVGGEREAQQAAIAMTGMWFYSHLDPDGDAFLRKVWPYMSYYADYFSGRVAKEGLLHLAEEWICFIPAPSSWPNAEVYSGLRAAAKAALRLGHEEEAHRWNGAADTLRARFRAQCYDTALGRIIPMAGGAQETFRDPEFPEAENRNGPMRDTRVDAGMLIIGRLDVFGRNQSIVPVDDPIFASTQAQVRRDLENPDHSIYRFGPNPGSPHAPKGELDSWPIIGSWAAQDEWLLGRTDLAWRYLLSGIVNKRGYDADASAYYLPEYWFPSGLPDKQLIVWSHGDFVTSTLLLFLGIDLEPKGETDLGLAPSLPPSMGRAHVNNVRFRGWHLDFDLSRSGGLVDVKLKAAAPESAAPLRILLPQGRILILRPGQTERFTVDPTQYYVDFGRNANAAERAAIAARILSGHEPPSDLARMAPEQLEAFMNSIEAQYGEPIR